MSKGVKKSMNEQTKNLIALLLSKFPTEPEPIVLIKLVYLCELEAVEKYGKRVTDLKFIHYRHGPYSSELQNTYGDGLFSQINLNKIDPDLILAVETIAEKWVPRILSGGKQGLINQAYHTLPFQETAYGQEIDFNKHFGKKHLADVVVNRSLYKKLANPKIKLYTHKELQSSIAALLEQIT